MRRSHSNICLVEPNMSVVWNEHKKSTLHFSENYQWLKHIKKQTEKKLVSTLQNLKKKHQTSKLHVISQINSVWSHPFPFMLTSRGTFRKYTLTQQYGFKKLIFPLSLRTLDSKNDGSLPTVHKRTVKGLECVSQSRWRFLPVRLKEQKGATAHWPPVYS